ncbi:MAG: AMP-binding protein, partial [Gammaproteobacteria bacterium]|nr:AMP-binding protein [Gammaproteobacteria bacterium]
MTETRIETIGALIHQQALRDPAAGAVFAEQSVAFTYGELLQQMRSVAAVIRAANFGPRQRIALVLPNGPEMATAFLTISAVCACAPLNPGYREKELEFYLGDLNADGVVVAAGKDNGVRSVTSRLGLRVFELFTKAEYPAGRFDLNTLPTATDTEFDEPGPEDVALLLHTSGTTSRPKLVPLTHANLVRSANNIASTLALGRHDRCLNVMPLFHIHGLIGAVLSTIVSGGQLFCARAFASGPFFTWLREFRPTWYTAVPTIHQAILGEMRQGRGPRRYDGFRFIRSSSSSLPTTVMRELEDQFGVPAIESYGMTEAAHQMASNPLPPRARKPGSAGLPAGPAITILDNEGRQLDAKVKGEIAIRGDNVTRGYERNPDANRKSFTDGWFRTGDQGYLDDEGYLFITGRIKELVNRGGQKIAPLEVEEILLSHEAVDEAACFAVPHTRLGEDLAAAVTVTGPGWDGVKLRKFVSQYLVDYKVPSQILIVDDIPKGPTGKLQRVSLADRLNHLLKVEYVPPRDDIEKLLADVWTRVLDIERIGLLDNVYLLGADSIAVTRALASINQRLSIELSVDIVFEAPTIREQALRVDLFRGRSRSSLDKASRITRKYRAEAPLSYAQERLWFLDQLEAGFIEHNRPTNLQLIGPVDVSILERTLNLIVDRHAVLRTAFT